MKLGPASKLDRRNKTAPKKFDEDFLSANCDAIVIGLIYGQFGAIRILDTWSVIITFLLIKTFNLKKTENRTKKYLAKTSYCFGKRYYFWKKILIFCKKNANISKGKKVLVLKGIISETKYVLVPAHRTSSF